MKRTVDISEANLEPERGAPGLRAGNDSQPGNHGKRPRILAAALKLFAMRPYQVVTMEQVAKAAGVAKGTLYLYFPSKEALYIGILTDGLESAAMRYQAGVDSTAGVVERLRHAIDVSIGFYGERRDLLRLIATEEPRMAEARSRLLEEWRERGYTFFSTLIDEGVAQGVFAPTDSRLATFAILGGMRSVLLYYGDNRPVGDLSQDFCDFVIRGLGRTGAFAPRMESRP